MTIDDRKVGQILALYREKKSLRKIAELVHVSKSGVEYVLRHRLIRTQSRKRGVNYVVSATVRRAIIREASKTGKSAGTIHRELSLSCSVRTVQRYLSQSAIMRWKKIKVAPRLLERHKLQRLAFAKKMLPLGQQYWHRVVFSDEKRFCLDGPDGNAYYWHDIRKEPRYMSKRHSGGGGIMVWICMSARGSSGPTWIQGNMNAELYIEVLEMNWEDATDLVEGHDMVFQQDNARPHTAKVTKEWFEKRKIDVMEWPAYSPDLNPVENYWGYIVRSVYQNFKQYNSVDELKVAIKKSVYECPLEKITNMVMSMPKRLMEVIEMKGGKTHY